MKEHCRGLNELKNFPMLFSATKMIAWLQRFFLAKNLDEKSLKRNTIMLVLSVVNYTTIFFHTTFAFIMGARLYAFSGVALLINGFATLTIIKVFKNINFDLVSYIGSILVSTICFVFIVLVGGIPYSGGLIVGSVSVVLYSVHFARVKWSVFFFLHFTFFTILVGILQPILKIEPDLPPNLNLIFYITMSIWLCGYTLLFVTDIIKERVRTEELMVKNLQELDKAKTNLYTNITHEFRTPITVILGITEILNEQLNDEQKEDLAIISRNGEKLLNLVNQMLDLARLDSGTIELNKINGNIIESVNYVIASFESISKIKNTRVHKLYDTPEIIMDYDIEKMESILTNLLDNALKNTKNGDIYVIISHEKENNNLMIKIKDTGSGIPAEFANKIFDRFFQVEKSESGLTGGTGIGLAIVKEYVQFMGGEIRVKSEINKGTEFSIQIPITNELTPAEVPHRKKITSHQTAIEKSVDTKNKKDLPVLLIIEDNEDLIQFLVKLLNNEYEIVVAHNGKEGIDKALERIPDIIISDVMMPEMNGFEVTDRLKNDLRTSHIPVLLLTAKADEKSKISGLSFGADAYMIKPFNKKELKIRLEKLIELRKKLKSRYEYYIPELIPTGKGTSLNETFLKKIKEDLEKNYSDENYNTEQLCKNIGVSRVQLFRKLKALTGNAPSLMIRSYRLEKAKNLIISTDRQIAEIAYNCGFGNATYFSQIFTETYGYSPTQMRNMEHADVTKTKEM